MNKYLLTGLAVVGLAAAGTASADDWHGGRHGWHDRPNHSWNHRQHRNWHGRYYPAPYRVYHRPVYRPVAYYPAPYYGGPYYGYGPGPALGLSFNFR